MEVPVDDKGMDAQARLLEKLLAELGVRLDEKVDSFGSAQEQLNVKFKQQEAERHMFSEAVTNRVKMLISKIDRAPGGDSIPKRQNTWGLDGSPTRVPSQPTTPIERKVSGKTPPKLRQEDQMQALREENLRIREVTVAASIKELAEAAGAGVIASKAGK